MKRQNRERDNVLKLVREPPPEPLIVERIIRIREELEGIAQAIGGRKICPPAWKDLHEGEALDRIYYYLEVLRQKVTPNGRR